MTTIGYYGNFHRPWNTESYVASALERAGFTVIRQNRGKKKLIDCDYFLCGKLYSMDLIVEARKRRITTISWVFDSPRVKGRGGSNHPHFKTDIVITTDPDDGNYTIRQAVDKLEKLQFPGKKIYDVVFIGSMYYSGRREMIKRVKPKPIVFNNKRGLTLNKLLGQTKIILGDSYPLSGAWSNRVYEMTGRGGFLIHPEVRDLYDYIPQFERGKENEMIQYYLENEDEREKLRKIQFEKCPTYDDRIKDLIRICKIKM